MSLVRFNANGEAVFIYEDGHPCLDLGRGVTMRASHVEPTEDGSWKVNLSVIGGPILSKTKERKESLSKEVSWINQHVIM